MSDSRWHRIEELFHRASQLPEDGVERQLLAWCHGDRALCDEVLALLASDSVVAELMASGSPAGDFLRRESPEAVGSVQSAADPWVGKTVGAFFLERVLGHGGMGVVYLGRRRGDDLAQNVAVKVIARHLRTSMAVERFLAERHVLGRLEHKHIARLIGGGVEEGTPYVAMEYVQGRRLDEVCDDPATTVTTKIALVLQLCEAVAYIHGQLILHRDLKPGNVMVTDTGQVKLLDFGALKKIDVEAADSLLTRAGMRSVTLRYASPEYLAGRTVSTATDIYSLGLILGRLLCGRLPPVIAVIQAPRGLRNDLSAIVSKATRQEPERRYSSVDAFSRDLHNALLDLPVAAHRGGWRYRAQKFLSRHRAVLLGAAAVGLTLALGFWAVAREANIANAETDRARAGVEDERKLAHLLLFDYFEELKRIPASTEAQRKAVSQALAYLDRLGPETALPVLTQDRVDAYTKMGNLLGSPYEENIGDGDGARQTLTKAVALARQLLATNPGDLHYLQSAAAAELSLGRVYFGAGDPQHAVQYLKSASETSRRIAHTAGVDSATIAQAASVVDSLGDVYGQEGAVTLDDPATAITTYETAQSLDALGLRTDPNCARCRRGVALEYWKMGMLMESLDQEHAAELYSEGLETISHSAEADKSTARVQRLDTVLRQRRGKMLFAAGRFEEGLAMLSEVQRRFQGAVRADPTDARAQFDLAALDVDLAEAYDRQGKLPDALAANREYLAMMDALVVEDATNVSWQYHRAEAQLSLGHTLIELNDTSKGSQTIDAGVNELVRLARSAQSTAMMLVSASNALSDAHRDPQLALTFAVRATADKKPSAEGLLTLARAQRGAGLHAESIASARAALQLLMQHPKSLGNAEQAAQARGLLGT